jgi:hypothetical protein
MMLSKSEGSRLSGSETNVTDLRPCKSIVQFDLFCMELLVSIVRDVGRQISNPNRL